MNRLTILIIVIFLLNNCSSNEGPTFWKDEKIVLEDQQNTKKILTDKKKIYAELNPELKIDLSKITINNKIIENKNDYGSQNYEGEFEKKGNYKFSKLEGINHLNFKPIFLEDGLIFFDKKGSIIRYTDNQKVLWKKNYYSKSEKKLKPKLYFALDNENLLVADNIAKYYSININTGELNWSKRNVYPFNSYIKKNDNKIFVVDYKNILRCYDVKDGSECWNLQTEDSFTISDSKYPLIMIKDTVVFSNSIGDITAVDTKTGLIVWQLPTQKNSIINKAYNFKMSKLVSDGLSIFFSNTENEFYSIDTQTGTTNWINEINSNITPIIIKDLIFTVSKQGQLFVIQKNNGNIIRITDLFKDYKEKKRKNIYPVGFVVGKTKLYLTNNDGKMIIVDLSQGNILNAKKIARGIVSEPFIFNKNLYVIKNGSIIRYN